MLYVPISVNHKGQADRVIQYFPVDSPEARKLNVEYMLIKDREKPKYLPSEIWKRMQTKGFSGFKQYQHTKLCQSMNAKEKSKGYGIKVANTWYWYEKWIEVVEKYCTENKDLYE